MVRNARLNYSGEGLPPAPPKKAAVVDLRHGYSKIVTNSQGEVHWIKGVSLPVGTPGFIRYIPSIFSWEFTPEEVTG